MDEESIPDANNVTEDTFSHMSNIQRDNENAIFTSEKIDKSDELVDALKDLKIKNNGYYASNLVSTSDLQGDITCDQKIVTHTINGKEKVTDTSNDNFEKNY